jgi:hypothetical protein
MGEVRVHDHNRTYALAALDDECRKLASLTQGSGRNAALNSAAFSLGQFVPSGALTEAEIKEAIFNASVSNGYVHQDGREAALKTIESGLRAGMQQPRTVPQSDHGRRRTHRGNGQHRPRTEPTIEAGDTIVGDPVGELLAQPPNRVPVPMAEPDWNNPGREFFYNSADGEKVLHKSVRFPLIYPDGTPALSKKGKPDKTFVQFHQDERGAWVKGRGGDAVPYHLDDLAAVRQAGRTDVVVLIFEGEAKADLVHQRDKDKSIIAISIPKGCKGYGPRFAGLPTVIFPDNDDPGRKYRDLVAAEINPHAGQRSRG